MYRDVYFKENLMNTKASHGTFGQLILLFFKSLLSKLRRTRASFQILALPEPSRFPAHKCLASSSYIIHWINISFEYLLWSIKPPHFLPSHRTFQWTTFLSLWKPLHKVRRLMSENTFSGTEIKMRAIASVSALGIKVTLRLFNDGFEQIKLFLLSGRSPEVAR